jgi:glycerol-3-phosphate dehydrogenase
MTDRPRRPRVIGIYGGKLTGWRATAATVMKRLEGALPETRRVADTARLRLQPDAG